MNRNILKYMVSVIVHIKAYNCLLRAYNVNNFTSISDSLEVYNMALRMVFISFSSHE